MSNPYVPLIEELLSDHCGHSIPHVKLHSPFTIASIFLADPEQKLYYVDIKSQTLWRKKEWLEDLDRIKKDREQQAVYRKIYNERAEVVLEIRKRLGAKLHLPDSHSVVISAAYAILTKGASEVAKALDIDISKVPRLPEGKYINLNNPDWNIQ